jgi:mono/diheme cytochrome c family protein
VRPAVRVLAIGAFGALAALMFDAFIPAQTPAGRMLLIDVGSRALGGRVDGSATATAVVGLGALGALAYAYGGFRELGGGGAVRMGAAWGLVLAVLVSPFVLPLAARVLPRGEVAPAFALVSEWTGAFLVYGIVLGVLLGRMRTPLSASVVGLVLLCLGACRGPTSEPGRPRELLAGSASGLPMTVSDLAAGRTVFVERCTSCHGDGGRGDGPEAALLVDALPDFTDRAYMELQVPAYYAEAIRMGVPGRAMPRFDHVLTDTQRWDAALYAWSLGAPQGAVGAGADLYRASCQRCHGAHDARADGALLGGAAVAGMSRASVRARIRTAHSPGIELTDDQLAAVAEYLYSALYDEMPDG